MLGTHLSYPPYGIGELSVHVLNFSPNCNTGVYTTTIIVILSAQISLGHYDFILLNSSVADAHAVPVASSINIQWNLS